MNRFETTRFLMLVSIIWLMLFATIQCAKSNNKSIHPHSSGQAVYIEGNSCIVNNVDLTHVEFKNLLEWCSDQHQAHNQVPKTTLLKGWYHPPKEM